jgi:hypothetical protein
MIMKMDDADDHDDDSDDANGNERLTMVLDQWQQLWWLLVV